MGCTLLRSRLPSSASPSRWSRPAFPSHCPSSRSLLSLLVSHSHLSWLALLRSAPCLERLSSRRSLSSQLCSARLSSSQSPASLRFLHHPLISTTQQPTFEQFVLSIWLHDWHFQNSKFEIIQLALQKKKKKKKKKS